MSSPTRQEIIDAYDALENLECTIRWEDIGKSGKEAIAFWKNAILAALPPVPKLTMADMEWDDEKHYLAEAKHYICGNVIMLGPDHDGSIEFFVPKFHASRYDAARPYTLIPTGRRYTLTEAQE